MKRKIIPKVTLALLGLSLLFFSACDSLISIAIQVVNNSSNSITAWLVYGDDHQQTERQSINSGASHNFYITIWDSDKYTEVTVYAEEGGHTYYSNGNVAENDWTLVVSYPADFSY